MLLKNFSIQRKEKELKSNSDTQARPSKRCKPCWRQRQSSPVLRGQRKPLVHVMEMQAEENGKDEISSKMATGRVPLAAGAEAELG